MKAQNFLQYIESRFEQLDGVMIERAVNIYNYKITCLEEMKSLFSNIVFTEHGICINDMHFARMLFLDYYIGANLDSLITQINSKLIKAHKEPLEVNMEHSINQKLYCL